MKPLSWPKICPATKSWSNMAIEPKVIYSDGSVGVGYMG